MSIRILNAWIEDVYNTWLLGRTATINDSGEVGIITKVKNVTFDNGINSGYVIEVTIPETDMVCIIPLELVGIK